MKISKRGEGNLKKKFGVGETKRRRKIFRKTEDKPSFQDSERQITINCLRQYGVQGQKKKVGGKKKSPRLQSYWLNTCDERMNTVKNLCTEMTIL